MQREFSDTFSPAHTIRLSSAGLVYRSDYSLSEAGNPATSLTRASLRTALGSPVRHYGKEAIASVLGIAVDDERMPLLYNKVYEVGFVSMQRSAGLPYLPLTRGLLSRRP